MIRPINSPFVADMPDDYARKEQAFPHPVQPDSGAACIIIGFCAFAVFVAILFCMSL